jgi:transposase
LKLCIENFNILSINKKLLPAGWKAKEIMNIIYERTGIRYHEVHIYRLLHKWKFSSKVPKKRLVNTASNEEKKQHIDRLIRRASSS